MFAGIIAELARSTLPGEFRRIVTCRARVPLIEIGPRVSRSSMPDHAGTALVRPGVGLRKGVPVTARDADGLGIGIGEERIALHTAIRTAGVKASHAAR